MAPAWRAFRQRHPKANLEVNLSDRLADLAEEGFDVAVRIARLASTRIVPCASPKYLRRAGTPNHPFELARPW